MPELFKFSISSPKFKKSADKREGAMIGRFIMIFCNKIGVYIHNIKKCVYHIVKFLNTYFLFTISAYSFIDI